MEGAVLVPIDNCDTFELTSCVFRPPLKTSLESTKVFIRSTSLADDSNPRFVVLGDYFS